MAPDQPDRPLTTAAPPSLLLRERALRVLAVLPTYDPLAESGEEEYVRRVIEGLAKRGAAVQVLTTFDRAVRQDPPGAFVWDNAMVRVQPPEAPVAVRRFKAAMLPRFLRKLGLRIVETARHKRMRSRALGLGYSYLDSGFHELEHWKSGFPFRWTGPVAHFQIDRPGGADVVVELYAPGIANMDVLVDGHPVSTITLRRESWQKVELPLPGKGIAHYELRVRPTFRPRGDTRELGVALRSVTVRTRQADDLPIPLDRERDSLLRPLDTFRLGEQYEADGEQWGRAAAWWDGILKGPASARMDFAARRAARESDVVLVAGSPYLTSVYGARAARKAGKPLVAIPSFRLRDPEHHRPWNREALRSARHVFTPDDAMARYVESRWKQKATVLPGGVDAAALDDPAIDGRRFRTRHGLDARPLVLMLAPKSTASKYLAFCAAAEGLRDVAQFVLAGPEHDGLPMPAAVRYLGPLRPEEARDAVDACDVFVVPAPDESDIGPVLRAWMRRKPVVGHATAEPVRELIRPGEDGLLVNSDAELGPAVRRLVEDPALRTRFGARGRQRAVERYTWDHVASTIDEVMYAMGVRERS